MPIDMTSVTLVLPYELIDQLHTEAARRQMPFDTYMQWALRMCLRMRFVPLIGTCR